MSTATKNTGAVRSVHDWSIPKEITRRVDLPPEAYAPKNNESKYRFAKRPSYNTTAPGIKVMVNQFRVSGLQNADVYQYDLSVSPEPKGEIVYKKLWATKKFKDALTKYNKSPWIHDGVKLAWSSNNVTAEIKFTIDLGEEQGREPGRHVFFITMKQSTKIRLEMLAQYLKGNIAWDKTVLECMNCLDHILRQGPSETFKLIKRTHFNDASEARRLSPLIEAVKGVYSAFRLTDSVNLNGLGLGVNVDVSNQSFWIGQSMDQLIRNYLASLNQREWGTLQIGDLAGVLRPKVQGGKVIQSEAFKALKRLQRIKFLTTHNQTDQREYSINQFFWDASKGAEGANAKNVTFKRKVEGSEKMEDVTIFDYYLNRYNCKITYWQLPLIMTGKGGLFPIETCKIRRLNPYPFKLDPQQTQEMIKFAVQRPKERKMQIMKSVALLNWGQDKYLNAFKIKVSPDMPAVQARLIPNPEVGFSKGKKLDPKINGRWDLRGYQFFAPNKLPLESWGIVITRGALDRPTVTAWISRFKAVYQGHGGQITSNPVMLDQPGNVSTNQLIDWAYHQIGSTVKKSPQIIMFIMKTKDTITYETLKRSADCGAGVVTQMVQANHVRKGQDQYHSNVAMKVNAKLGGKTSCAVGGPKPPGGSCIIGVDVSHAAPGVDKSSMASMCMSMDQNYTYYQGRVQTNGWRVEILERKTIETMLTPMLTSWMAQNGNRAPPQIFYFRDGVAEGQFVHVLEYEIKVLEEVFKKVTKAPLPKITVIIATKRHHIRFFPERGDRNGNPMPGTLLDREVTHPFHYDFYLCSHVAIQGTARPVHYTVIRDDIKMKPDDLQKMIYHQCYQYARSTTPVSLHPAVYYAHLAGNRGRPHELEVPVESKDKKTETSKNKNPPPPVTELASRGRDETTKKWFREAMWYI